VANGMGAPSFLARLPDRQADLGLSDAALGVTLVGLAFGALVASPVVARMLRRWSSRRMAVAAGVGLGSSLWLVGEAPSAPTFFLTMAVVGVFDAAMDIAMNANGAAYEALTGRSVLHRLHAAWSLGALAAAALAGLAAAAGLSLTTHLLLVGALAAVATFAARRYLVPGDALPEANVVGVGASERPEPQISRERRGQPALLALAAAVVGGALIEGGTNDWASVQLERYGTGEALAAAGVACFMGGMLSGRLVGDRLVERWGGARLLRTGTALAAGGLAAGALIPHPVVFAAGVFAAGLGAAGMFPLAFSAAARIPGVAPGTGAAAVSLAARAGFVVEPVLLGVVAEQAGLRSSYGLVAVVAATLAVAAPRVLPAAGAPAGP
jgi:Major Facilitator Superfamily